MLLLIVFEIEGFIPTQSDYYVFWRPMKKWSLMFMILLSLLEINEKICQKNPERFSSTPSIWKHCHSQKLSLSSSDIYIYWPHTHLWSPCCRFWKLRCNQYRYLSGREHTIEMFLGCSSLDRKLIIKIFKSTLAIGDHLHKDKKWKWLRLTAEKARCLGKKNI